MDIKFQAGIGVPASCKVKYDDEGKLLKCYTDRRRLRSCCKIISADFNLKLLFTVKDGAFIGFEYNCLMEQLPDARLNKPMMMDGFVKMEVLPYIKRGYHCVTFTQIEARYDKEAKYLCIGEEKNDLSYYKICKNMAFGIDSDGRLSCIFIET